MPPLSQSPSEGGAAPSLLLHPVSLFAMALLLLNDHYLKAAYPGWWTGKLSDVAGLVFFPCLLQAVWQSLRPASSRSSSQARSQLWAASIATALVFAAIQVWPFASEAYRSGLGAIQWPFLSLLALVQAEPLPDLALVHLVADPSDLLALPAAFAWILLDRRRAP